VFDEYTTILIRIYPKDDTSGTYPVEATTAAYHDLGAACMAQMGADPAQATSWCQEALRAFERAYQLSERDPGFSDADRQELGDRIERLRPQCGPAR
jgi:hypothetical protein